MASECKCVMFHVPANPPIERHHYPPTSYPLKDGGVRLIIPMCANAHGIQHRLLNLLRSSATIPRGYSAYHRLLAEHTRANTDTSQPLPRTLSHE